MTGRQDAASATALGGLPDSDPASKRGGAELTGAVKKRKFSTLLFSLCLLFLAVRVPFIFTIPMVEAPDEYAHFWVLRFMHDNMRLPSAIEVAAGGPSAVYGSLPQFGYIPHILVGSIFHANDFVLFARFGSLLMGVVLLYCAYGLGRELFPRQRLLALALPLAVIFHPQLAFVHSYMNNDATSSAVASVILLMAVRSLRQGLEMRRSLVMGLLIGWLALTKYSGLGILPSIAVCLIGAAVINRVPLTTALANFAACGTVAAGVCGWWFVRNVHEFGGDLLGTKTMYSSWAKTFDRPQTYYLPATHIIKNTRWWRMMFFSFWGMFGYMNKYMWRPIYFAYLGYVCVAGVGFANLVRGWIGNLKHSPASDGAPALSQKANTVAWSALTLAVVLNLAAMVWASTTNLGGPQGRYLFTSELPVLALIIAGLNNCGKRVGVPLVMSFLIFNALVCIGAWFWLYGLYGFHGHPI